MTKPEWYHGWSEPRPAPTVEGKIPTDSHMSVFITNPWRWWPSTHSPEFSIIRNDESVFAQIAQAFKGLMPGRLQNSPDTGKRHQTHRYSQWNANDWRNGKLTQRKVRKETETSESTPWTHWYGHRIWKWNVTWRSELHAYVGRYSNGPYMDIQAARNH